MKTKTFIVAIFVTMISLGAQAVPVYDTFGPESMISFGGTGIPNDAVARSYVTINEPDQFGFGGGIVSLALTAHQRYDNPALTNDGAGTFFAQTGGDAGNGQPGYGIWNFGLWTSDSGLLIGYRWGLSISGSTIGTMSSGPIPGPIGATGYQDSWNLGMGFLGLTDFDPLLDDTYNITLYGFDPLGVERVRTSIDVVVGNGAPVSVPEEGATAAMLAIGMVSLAGLRRRLRSL